MSKEEKGDYMVCKSLKLRKSIREGMKVMSILRYGSLRRESNERTLWNVLEILGLVYSEGITSVSTEGALWICKGGRW